MTHWIASLYGMSLEQTYRYVSLSWARDALVLKFIVRVRPFQTSQYSQLSSIGNRSGVSDRPIVSSKSHVGNSLTDTFHCAFIMHMWYLAIHHIIDVVLTWL